MQKEVKTVSKGNTDPMIHFGKNSLLFKHYEIATTEASS